MSRNLVKGAKEIGKKSQPLRPAPKQKFKILSLGARGEGIARVPLANKTWTVAVDSTIPGESVLCDLVPAEGRLHATLLSVETPSPHRIAASCPHFSTCGACHIMHINYDRQLEIKADLVKDALGAINPSWTVSPCVPSPTGPFHYRNKLRLEVTVDAKGQLSLGYYHKQPAKGRVTISECSIGLPCLDDLVRHLGSLLKDVSITTGRLRQIFLKGTRSNQIQVILVGSKLPEETLHDLSTAIMKYPKNNIISIFYSTNPDQGEFQIIQGEPYLKEKIMDLEFRFSPAAFLQVNVSQAEQMYREALSRVTKDHYVIDAFCGVGTMACLAARTAKKVIGIECIEASVNDARQNAADNQLTNCEFVTGETDKMISSVLSTLPRQQTLVIINPPRTGVSPALLSALNKSKVPQIIYISCSPTTLSRDISVLSSFYQIEEIVPFDMFPQTMHVETFIALKRKHPGQARSTE